MQEAIYTTQAYYGNAKEAELENIFEFLMCIPRSGDRWSPRLFSFHLRISLVRSYYGCLVIACDRACLANIGHRRPISEWCTDWLIMSLKNERLCNGYGSAWGPQTLYGVGVSVNGDWIRYVVACRMILISNVGYS